MGMRIGTLIPLAGADGSCGGSVAL